MRFIVNKHLSVIWRTNIHYALRVSLLVRTMYMKILSLPAFLLREKCNIPKSTPTISTDLSVLP